MTTDEERVTRTRLSMLCRPGHRGLMRTLLESGSRAALETVDAAMQAEGSRAPGVPEALEMLERAEAAGVRFVVPGDAEWPGAALSGLDGPDFGDERGVAGCLGLWVTSRTPLPELLQRVVGVVGTRTPTGCGVHVATELAHGLADAGWGTVSGAAYGVDTAAHRGSLVGGGVTIAAVAGGADVRYPVGNAGLLDRIAVDGAIVSEVPPGCAPTRSRFLVRNRLIAALSVGTVLVEASLRSGARNTLAHARALHRHTLVVPGQVTSPMSAGSNLELRRPGAVAVMSAADVLESVAVTGEHLQLPIPQVPGLRDGLTPFDAEVLDAVPVRQGRPTGSIARAAGAKPVLLVAAALARLESAGLVTRNDSGYLLTARGRAPVASPGPG